MSKLELPYSIRCLFARLSGGLFMLNAIKPELKMLAQYLVIALLAGAAGFFLGLPSDSSSGEYVIAINMHEA